LAAWRLGSLPVPRDDIELVRSAFEAWNRGDIDAFAGHAAEDVAWLEVSGRPEGAPTERLGRDRMRTSLESLFDAWESYHLEVERVEEVGDRVVAVVREVARGRASGVEIDSRWGYLVTVEEGLIVRIEAYRDAGQALQVAGLSR
jgi:ketosteroid isomerase-like protein